jgi:hypothetical protein
MQLSRCFSSTCRVRANFDPAVGQWRVVWWWTSTRCPSRAGGSATVRVVPQAEWIVDEEVREFR